MNSPAESSKTSGTFKATVDVSPESTYDFDAETVTASKTATSYKFHGIYYYGSIPKSNMSITIEAPLPLTEGVHPYPYTGQSLPVSLTIIEGSAPRVYYAQQGKLTVNKLDESEENYNANFEFTAAIIGSPDKTATFKGNFDLTGLAP